MEKGEYSSELYTVFRVLYGVCDLMVFQNHLCDIESKPASVPGGFVCAVKSLKEMRQVFFINMRICIDNRECCPVIHERELDQDRTRLCSGEWVTAFPNTFPIAIVLHNEYFCHCLCLLGDCKLLSQKVYNKNGVDSRKNTLFCLCFDTIL